MVASLGAQCDKLMRKAGYTNGTVGERFRQMYADPKQHYPNTDEGKIQLIADLNKKVEAITPKLPKYFGQLSKAPLEIRRVPKAIEAGAPGGYYNSPTLDGSRPGIYWINLRDSAEQPRSRPSPSPSQQPAKIYTWESTEGGRSAQQRQPIEVDGVIFDPSSTEGFYSRRTNQHPVEGRDGEGDAAFSEYTSFNSKYMDFQVILTNEELTALAARKRADRRDIKSDKSQAASASPLTASPYIEPRRIRDALLRPDQPEKWIGSAGIALGPYQKH
eukprot:gene36193-48732_t